MTAQISVVIPSIPVRGDLLARAVSSVAAQMHPATAIHISIDHQRRGAPANRDRGLEAVTTDWVAFLDDDDELYPHHLAALAREAERTGADLVYPWFDVIGGTDPFPELEGQPWADDCPHQVPVTWLARTDVIRKAGGFSAEWNLTAANDPGVDAWGNRAGEDYRLILRLVEQGAHITHLPVRTWAWHHDSGNTSGLPSRW